MKKLVAKTLLFLGLWVFGGLSGLALVNAQAPTEGGFANQGDAWASFGLAGGTAGSGTTVIDVVKKFINFALGMLSLIALGMALFGGFKMVTAAGDDGKYKEGFKVLKQAAIGIVVVGLSWIIVSSIFWFLGKVV